jgi:hypothetical protein
MEWLIDNWFLVLITAVFIGMRLSGRGCCGHGKHEKHTEEGCDEHKGHSDIDLIEEKAEKKSHGCCG